MEKVAILTIVAISLFGVLGRLSSYLEKSSATKVAGRPSSVRPVVLMAGVASVNKSGLSGVSLGETGIGSFTSTSAGKQAALAGE
jgi:hypothetical protein